MSEADKYIYFEMIEQKPKTQVWAVQTRTNPSERIGLVKWYGPWRHYCFFPEPDTIYSDRCMLRIGQFIEELNQKHREGLKE